MNTLIWIVAILAIITVIGHGIWVTLRAIAGWLSQPFDRADARPIAAVMCPRCGEAWDSHLGIRRCTVCGWPSAHAPSSLLGESAEALANLRTRVERYAHLGLLSVAVRNRLLQALRDEVAPGAIGEAERVVIAPTSPRRPPAIAPPDVPKPAREVPEPVRPFDDIAARAWSKWADREDEAARAPAAEPTAREIPPLDVPEPVRDAAEPVRPLEDIAARARSYRSAREDEAARAPTGEPTPTAPPPPGLRILLGAFLEERNIRWGEIVGGLLIVGCSLALVISFWASIAERPFLKYGLLNGLTALLFAIGISAERRWKLPSTAQGLLVIATLLTPLNFLAVAALGRGEVVESAWGIAAELGSAALFAWLTYRAGQTLVSRAPGGLTVGVLIPSIAMLLIRRWLAPGGGSPTLLALGAIPLSAQTAAVGALIFRLRRQPEDQERDADELLRLLGAVTFATSLALGLILARGGPIPSTLHRLTPLAPLAAVPALAAGLWLWRRTTEPRLVSLRTTGAAIAAAGTMLMLAGLAVAGGDDPGGPDQLRAADGRGPRPGNPRRARPGGYLPGPGLPGRMDGPDGGHELARVNFGAGRRGPAVESERLGPGPAGPDLRRHGCRRRPQRPADRRPGLRADRSPGGALQPRPGHLARLRPPRRLDRCGLGLPRVLPHRNRRR